MNSRENTVLPLIAYGAVRQRRYRIAAGALISLALHAVLLWVFRQGALVRESPEQAGATRTMTVWLRTPEIAHQAEAPPEPRPRAQRQARVTHPAASARAPARLRPQRDPERDAAPDAFALQPDPAPGAAPHFDQEAAHRLARQIASEPDFVQPGSAGAQLPPKPYETQTKTARAIASAKRRDCKDGLPGGLLAPLFLLMDKKDSGCKW